MRNLSHKLYSRVSNVVLAFVVALSGLTAVGPFLFAEQAAAAGGTFVVRSDNMQNWLFYNDENDTINNSLGSFVVGPGTAPLGAGSAQISVSGTERRNLATYQFANTPFADISELGFQTYNPSAGNGGSANRSAFLNVNVSFDGNDTWQRRLIFMPSDNGTITQNTWQNWDAIKGGAALWRYSGATWPGTATPGTTPRALSDLLSSYPNLKIRATDAHVGLRVGDPYANGYTENIDKFYITIDGSAYVYDFEPIVPDPEFVGLDTYYVKDIYKGIGVDIATKYLADATAVEVKVDRTTGGPVIKTAKTAVLNLLNDIAYTGVVKSVTAPIVIQPGSYNEAGSSSWNQPSATWSAATIPTKVTVTITRVGGATLVLEKDLTGAMGPFATLSEVMPPDTDAPVVNFVTPTPDDNSYVKGTISGKVAVQDNVGMGSYYVRWWKDAFESGLPNLLKNDCYSAPGGLGLGMDIVVDCSFNTTSVADGTTVVLSAQFLDGNNNWGSALRSFIVDNKKPTNKITAPLAETTQRGTFTIKGKATDATSGIDYVKVLVTKYNSTGGFAGYLVDEPVAVDGDGNYELKVTLPHNEGPYGYRVHSAAYDRAGNRQDTEQRPVYVDTEAPSAPVLEVIGLNSGDHTNQLSITATWNKPSTDTVSYVYEYWNDIPTSPWNESNKWSTPVYSESRAGEFDQGEGTHYIRVKAIDHLGHESDWSNTFEVTFDETAPLVTLNGDAEVTLELGAQTYNEEGATWDDNIDGSGDVTDITGTVDSATIGTYTVTYTYTDAAGNTGTATRTVNVVDTTPPVLTVNNYTGTNLTPTLTGTTDGADDVVTVDGVEVDSLVFNGTTYTWSYTLPTQSVGTHTITIRSTDVAGNAVEETATVTVIAAPPLEGPDDTTTEPVGQVVTITPNNDQTVVAQAQGVLGDQTNTPSDEASQNNIIPIDAEADQDVKAATDDKNNGTIFGLAWYWWLIIAALIIALIAWIAGAYRKRQAE